jgi:hypothetical protein
VKAALALLAAALATGEVRTLSPGPFEASGAAAVPGTPSLLFVDDGRPGEVLWLELTAEGTQRGAVVAVPLGVEVTDPEGITTDGTHFYVVGSQSRGGKGDGGAGLVRFRFDPHTRSASAVETISGLRAWLAARVPELRGYERRGGERGLNIEGLAWDPDRSRLLLGLRSPLVDGMALIVPLKPGRGRFSADDLQFDGPTLRVDLGTNDGIRGMEYDAAARAYRIIAGGSQGAGRGRLVEWTAKGTTAREIRRFAPALKPEGVASTRIGGRDVTVVLCDSSQFLLLD